MKFQLDHALEILEQTPATLRIFLANLSGSWLMNNEGPETWSPFDILGHLIHGERTDWIPRAKIILEEGESRTFIPFDRFAQFQESQGKSVGELLDTFRKLRQANLNTLQAFHLTDEDLRNTGVHPEFAVVTMGQLLATWVVHDLSHIAQIAEVMARQYREAVGPWKAYLPVVQ